MVLPTRTETTVPRRRFDLFEDIDRVRRDMEQAFGSFGRWLPRFRTFETGPWTPSLDMFVDDDELVVRADVPGVDKKDVEVSVTDDGVLMLKGDRKVEKEIDEKDLFFRETAYGSFTRRIGLPFEIDPEDIEATFEDGVLEVRMPRPEGVETKLHEIPIR